MINRKNLPYVTSQEMAQLDKIAMTKYHFPLIAMMENAGRNLAQLATELLDNRQEAQIIVMAGKGHNGGGGLVAARHLHNWGYNVKVILSHPITHLRETTRNQLRLLDEKWIPRIHHLPETKVNLIIDALLGYNIRGNPRDPIKPLVEGANNHESPILSLDIPSGLNPDTGDPYTPCIKARATLTLALLKTGLVKPQAIPFLGQLYLVDIGIPKQAYQEVLKTPISFFTNNNPIHLE